MLDIFDYEKVKRLRNSIAVIPYFGGESPVAHANKLVNVVNYVKTYGSMQKYFERVVTFVQNDRDKNFLSLLPADIEIVQISCLPHHLPVSALNHVQTKDFKFKYIFYTEADHILYCQDISTIGEICDENTYVMPWRFTRIHSNLSYPTIKIENPCPVTQFDNKLYEVRNYLKSKKDGKFRSVDRARAFAGCWLAKKKFFINVDFKKVDRAPIESACFSMCEGGVAVKTNNPDDFFVDHLSGFEQTLKIEKDMNIIDFPGGW